jgi:hypothetical protein
MMFDSLSQIPVVDQTEACFESFPSGLRCEALERYKDSSVARHVFTEKGSEELSDFGHPDELTCPSLALNQPSLPVQVEFKIDVPVRCVQSPSLMDGITVSTKQFAHKPFKFRRVQATQIGGPLDKMASLT